MDWVDDSVAVGGWLEAHSNPDVDYIIDARHFFFDGQPRITELWDEVMNVIIPLATSHRILLRCFWGHDRAPFVAMVYLSRKYGMPYQEAYQVVKRAHPSTVFHWDWVDALNQTE